MGLLALSGTDTNEVLNEAGLPTDIAQDVDGRVSLREVEPVAAAIQARLGEEQILDLFSRLTAGTFGMLDYVIRNSCTLRESFERLVRYHRVNNTIAECTLARSDQVSSVSLTHPGGVTPTMVRLSSCVWVASCVTIARQMVGADWTPEQVLIPGDEPSGRARVAYNEFMRCRVSFGAPASTIVAADAGLDREVHAADHALAALLTPHMESALSHLDDGGTTSSQVRGALAGLCGGQDLTLEKVAARLGSSARTLQRRLQEEKTSFQQLLDQVRHELALVHMSKRSASLDEVAWLLGFSNSSAFHRAFKRWTGVTPGEFRRSA